MQLTTRETKHLEKLKMQEISYRRLRWPLLVIGIICIGSALTVFYMSLDLIKKMEPPFASSVIFLGAPILFATCACGGACIGMALKNWNGDPARILLIKVTEHLLIK